MTVTAGPAATAGSALTADLTADLAADLAADLTASAGTAAAPAGVLAPAAGAAGRVGAGGPTADTGAGTADAGAGAGAGTENAAPAVSRAARATTGTTGAAGTAGTTATTGTTGTTGTSATIAATATTVVTVVQVGRTGPAGPFGPSGALLSRAFRLSGPSGPGPSAPSSLSGPAGPAGPSGVARTARAAVPPAAPATARMGTATGTATGFTPGITPGTATTTGAVVGVGAAGGGPDREPGRVVRRTGFVLAADGSYAACLAEAVAPEGAPAGGRWFPERWTLDGPEPYAVSLAGAHPEDVGSARVLPLPDGRVLVMRRAEERYELVLAYPTGPRTGEVPVGSLAGAEVRLLPPSPAAGRVFALVPGAGRTTEIWQVHGDGARPARVMTVAGGCTGGVWLDRGGRLLALDRELDGRTKTVAVDLHTGEVSALLQITEDSDDRLLLAEPDSGLLVLRSDAPGEARLGWGVLGSRRPVRFPDSLRVDGALLTPVAAQPGQILCPDSCVVALRAQVPGGAESLVLWRPGGGRPHWRPAPAGWLGPTALWLPGRPLRLPYAVPDWPCGLAPYDAPPAGPRAERPSPVERPPGVRGRVARLAAVLPLQQAPLSSATAG